jgi:Sodium/hydrogen exchanger family
MFPIQNVVPSRYPPVVTWALIAANCVVFLIEISLSPRELDWFLSRFALIPARYFAPHYGDTSLALADYLAGQDQDISAFTFLRQFLIAGVAFAIIGVVARPVFRAALSWAAGAKSPELFLLCSLVLALGTAFVAHAGGLSPPIGAFLAGMVVGESDFRHQIEDDIRPFRDVLVGLFFVTIGMQVDLAIIAAAPWSVLGWLIMFVLGKALLVAVVGKALRWPTFVALRVGIFWRTEASSVCCCSLRRWRHTSSMLIWDSPCFSS